jgi:hypothetical protein
VVDPFFAAGVRILHDWSAYRLAGGPNDETICFESRGNQTPEIKPWIFVGLRPSRGLFMGLSLYVLKPALGMNIFPRTY